jgi:integrase
MWRYVATLGMPKRPNFQPIETPRGWMVSVPPAMAPDGKRQRKYFTSQQLAERFAKKLRGQYNQGERGGVISRELAIMATMATKLLEPIGLTLIEAARQAVDRAGGATTSETFRERYARAQLENEGRWSDRYAADMGRLHRYLPDWFLSQRCTLIDEPMTRRAVVEGGARALSTIDARSRYISAILRHREKHRKASEVRIMTLDQCRAVLRACESPEQRRAVALLLFAGIRPSAEDGEISRLKWDAVGESELYISPAVSKTNTDRHIALTPRLRRLLRDHPESGPVVPANWRRTWRRIRSEAGISDDQDIARHTFASHYLAAFGEDAAKQAMGHSKGSDTLFRHYRRAVTTEAGKRFFGVKGHK